MRELKWYYPRKLEEVVELLREPGVVPHGGGTGILRTGTAKLKGLIDLRGLPLHDFRASKESVEIGAARTFAEVVEDMGRLDPGSVLVQALSQAASTPLRNRITVGGSVALAPIWSDLLGPLVALGAEVSLIGAHEGYYPVADFVRDRVLHKGTLITGVRFGADRWRAHYFRAARTTFDYASFNLTVLLKKGAGGLIEDCRLVVVGNKRQFKRLEEQEKDLIGYKVGEVDFAALATRVKVDFTPKALGSPEYIRHLFGVELERGLVAVTA